jgi:lysophospholipase L1-like esterase
MKLYIYLCLFLCAIQTVKSQNTLFKEGDKVCFVGNSITHGGEFHHNILLYYMTRFPQQKMTFFNCGISGDVTGGILKRMNSDILVHQPTHAVIMIGMNDVKRNFYGVIPTNNADTLRLRQEALDVYKIQLDSIVRTFLSKNIKVILQKPSIYDQTAVLKTPNALGVNDALKTCADFTESLCQKYQIPSVDYWTIMTQLNAKMQQKDSSATIVSNDRVHPEAFGQLVMAYQFLKTMQTPPQYVSQIEVKKNKRASNKHSINCQITALSKQKGRFVFIVKENALPFPVVDNQREALDLVPFQNDVNQEILRVKKLKSGTYRLLIDSVETGVFSKEQLDLGINLSDYKQTPQYQQALEVKKEMDSLWKCELALRDIQWVEIEHLSEFNERQDFTAINAYLNQRFEEKYKNVFYAKYVRDQYDGYAQLKPKEAIFRENISILRQKAYDLAQPKPHVFELIFEK